MAPRLRSRLLAGSAALVAAAAGALALAGAGQAPASVRTPPRPAPRTELPPLPTLRPKVVEPGVATAPATPTPSAAPRHAAKAPVHAASRTPRRHAAPGSGGASVTRALALPNGVALPPLEAPAAVRDIVEAGDEIARTPYIWGGGHGKWIDHGYDCSGSVSFVLAAAGLLDHSQVAADFMRWGEPGPGRWVTIYAKSTHVFMQVAGIRFDTVARAQTGSRWVNDMPATGGYVARHPPGL